MKTAGQDAAPRRQAQALLLGIVVVATGLRLLNAATAPACARDAAEYDTLARRLAHGLGYTLATGAPTAFRPPAYPGFLAAVYALTGGSRIAAKGIDCALGVLTCILLFAVGKRLFHPAAGLWAAGLWAVNPLAVDSYFAAGTLCSETFVTLAVLLATYLLWYSFQSPRLEPSFAAGMALGLAILAKSSLLLLPFFLLSLWLLRAKRQRSVRPIALGAVAALGCAVVVLPWTARNAVAMGAFIPVSTNGGVTFYRSNNQTSDGGHTYPPGGLDRFGGLSEQARSKAFFNAGLKFLGAHADTIPWLVYRKLRMLCDPFYQSRARGGRATPNVWFLLCLPLGLAGFWVSIKRAPWWNAIVLGTLAELAFVTILFHGYARYRFPYETFLALWSGLGLGSGRWPTARAARGDDCS